MPFARVLTAAGARSALMHMVSRRGGNRRFRGRLVSKPQARWPQLTDDYDIGHARSIASRHRWRSCRRLSTSPISRSGTLVCRRFTLIRKERCRTASSIAMNKAAMFWHYKGSREMPVRALESYHRHFKISRIAKSALSSSATAALAGRVMVSSPYRQAWPS